MKLAHAHVACSSVIVVVVDFTSEGIVGSKPATFALLRGWKQQQQEETGPRSGMFSRIQGFLLSLQGNSEIVFQQLACVPGVSKQKKQLNLRIAAPSNRDEEKLKLTGLQSWP